MQSTLNIIILKNVCSFHKLKWHLLKIIILLVRFKLFKGFPHSSVGKESACNVGDLGSIPGLGRSPGEGKGYPLHSGLENSMDCIWGRKELDTTERLSFSSFFKKNLIINLIFLLLWILFLSHLFVFFYYFIFNIFLIAF